VSLGRPDRPPPIVVTRGNPGRGEDPEWLAGVTEPYVSAITRAGGEPIILFPSSEPSFRDASLARMAGLLLTGGTDIAPRRFGQAPAGARDVDEARDDMELAAWETAGSRGLPVLGICRGFQAINVFSGGVLTQHLEGHDGPTWQKGPPLIHRMRVVGGTQLARILRPTNPGTFVVQVNSSHHQGVHAPELAPSLVASGWSPAPGGELVEALEGRDPGRLILGVQSHPERTESTPPEFHRLFDFFVDAAWHTTRGIAAAASSSPGAR
jgi:putative glutamine amidotransferase